MRISSAMMLPVLGTLASHDYSRRVNEYAELEERPGKERLLEHATSMSALGYAMMGSSAAIMHGSSMKERAEIASACIDAGCLLGLADDAVDETGMSFMDAVNYLDLGREVLEGLQEKKYKSPQLDAPMMLARMLYERLSDRADYYAFLAPVFDATEAAVSRMNSDEKEDLIRCLENEGRYSGEVIPGVAKAVAGHEDGLVRYAFGLFGEHCQLLDTVADAEHDMEQGINTPFRYCANDEERASVRMNLLERAENAKLEAVSSLPVNQRKFFEPLFVISRLKYGQ